MARNSKPINLDKLVLIKPLLKYRITLSRNVDPIEVEANSIDIYQKTLEVSRVYEDYSFVICAYNHDEWEKIELVSEFPEET